MTRASAPIVFSTVDSDTYAQALLKLEKSIDKSVSFLQSSLYGTVQTMSHKEVLYIVGRTEGAISMCGVGIRYDAPGNIKFLYFPYGPVAIKWSPAVYDSFRNFIEPVAQQLRCAFVRIDPGQSALDDAHIKSISNQLARTASLQPRAEWLLDLTQDDEVLWMNFHKHARYNIRLADRANAVTTVYEPQKAPLDTFYELMRTTASRDSFGIFDKSYYQAYLSAMSIEDGFVVLTTIDNIPAATGLFVTHDKQTHYVFAGSSNDFRKIAPAYSVIWQAIRTARAQGETLFNFGGITEEVKGENLAGVTNFKKRFDGYPESHPNPHDIPVRTLTYTAFRLFKTLKR